MVDWGASGRVDEYHAYLVDPFTLSVVKEVPFIAEGTSVTYDYESENIAGARVKLAEGADYRIGGKSYMVRIVDVVTVSGEQTEDVLGTFFVDNCGSNSKFGHVARQLDCYSAMWRHSKDNLMNDFGRSAGTPIAEAIRSLVEADGGHLNFAADAGIQRVTETPVWFELGTEKLEVMREMARWISNEIVPEPNGSLLLRCKWMPWQLVPKFTFEDGKNCLYTAGIDWNTTRPEILNRVIYYYSKQNESRREVAELPPANEWSYQNIGYHRCEVVRVSEVPPEGLKQAAENHLAAHSGETIHIEIEHVGIPGLAVGDVVRYVNEADHTAPLNLVCQIIQMDVSALKPGRMTKTKLRIVRWE